MTRGGFPTTHFLKGYDGVRTLSAAELEATRGFVPLREIWIMGLHVGIAETFGCEFLSDDYFGQRIKVIKRWIRSYKIL